MPNITVGGLTDSRPLTVNTFLADPQLIPVRMLDMANQLFIADQLLRKAPQGWVYEYFTSTPLFSLSTPDVVAEFGEIPVSQNQLGPLALAKVVKRALGITVSKEMADRNRIDLLNTQIQQVSNTFVQVWDTAFMAAVSAAVTLTQAAAAAWSSTTTATPQKDITLAAQKIVDTKFGFRPDTLILPTSAVANLIGNPAVWSAWTGNVANLNPGVTGRLPGQFLGYDVWATYSLTNTALVCQREVLGFIGDERPLQASPVVWRPDNESWRTNIIRSSAVAIDQPSAVASITGI